MNTKKKLPLPVEEQAELQPTAARKIPLWVGRDAVEEDESARERSLRKFRCSGGLSRTVVGCGPLNYFDKEAQAWLPVTGELSETEEGYEGRCGNYRVNLRRGDKGNGVTLTAEDSSLSWEYVGKMYRGAKRNRAAKRAESVRCGTKNRDGAETVVYGKIDADLDMEYSVLGGGVKENLTILAPAATYAWGFRMQAQGLTPTLSPDAKEIVWQNEQGEAALTVPPAFMLDAKGAFCDSVVYALDKQEDGTYFLTVKADSTWLNDPTRAFPVVLDPQVVANNAETPIFTAETYTCLCQTDGTLAEEALNTNVVDGHFKVGVDPDGNVHEGRVTVHKSPIQQDYPGVYSAKMIVKLFSKFRPGKLFVTLPDGSKKTYTYKESDYFLSIDVSDAYRNATEDFTVIFSQTANNQAYADIDLSSVSSSRLELEFFTEEENPPILETFALTDTASACINLATGEKTTVIEDIPAERSVMGIPVCHVLKPGNGTLGLGEDFRLSVQEKLERIAYGTGNVDYVHTDSTGNRYGFAEHFYWLDDKGAKIYLNGTRDSLGVTVEPDGRLYTHMYGEVFVEYISSTGWKLMPYKEGYKGIALYEQRSDEQKQLEEQIKSLENALSEYVVFNLDSKEIVKEAGSFTYQDLFEAKTPIIDSLNILLTKSEAFQCAELYSQRRELLSDHSFRHIFTSTEQSHFMDDAEIVSAERAVADIQNTLSGIIQYYYETNSMDSTGEAKKILEYFAKEGIHKDRVVPMRLIELIVEDANYLLRPEEDAEKICCWNSVRKATLGIGTSCSENCCEDCVSGDTDNDGVEDTPDCFTVFKTLPTIRGSEIRSMLIQRNLYVQQINETADNTYEQADALKRQLDFICDNSAAYKKRLYDYYIAYETAQHQLSLVLEQTPIHFLTDGELYKGFNSDGRLVVVMDGYEQYAVVEYDVDRPEQVSRLYDANGKQVTLEYTPAGRLEAMTDAYGNRMTFEQADGYLTEICYPDGGKMTLTYSATGTLYTVTGRDGIRCTFPNSEGADKHISRVSLPGDFTSSEEGGNTATRFEYVHITRGTENEDGTRQVLVEREEANTTDVYVIDASNALVESYSLWGETVLSATKYEYVPFRLSATTAEARKVVQSATEESLRKTVEDVVFDGGTREYTRLNRFNLPETKTVGPVKVTPDGSVIRNETTSYVYDSEQRPVREETLVKLVSVPEGGTEETLDSYTAVTETSYNAQGKVVRTKSYVKGEETVSGITVEETVYNGEGKVVETKSYNTLDPSSQVCERSVYTEEGDVCAVYDETGEHRTELTYTEDGASVRTQELPNGSKLSYGYDFAGKRVAVTHSTAEGEENSTRKTYTYGLVTELHSADNEVLYGYDLKRRLKTVTLNGDTVASVNYIATSLTYNGVLCEQHTVTLANGHKVNTVVKKGTQQVQRIRSIWNNVNKDVVFTYDENDNLLTRKLMQGSSTKQTETYTYDGLNRVTSYVKNKAGVDVVTEAYTYDNRGSLLEKQVTVDGVTTVTAYTYKDTAARELNSMTMGELCVKPKVDFLGRNTGKTVLLGDSEVEREKLSYRKVGDHATAQPSSVTYKDGTYVQYTYDEMGNIAGVLENGKQVARYTYDALGRLVREDNQKLDKTVTFTYDKNGNILAKREYGFTLMSMERMLCEAETPVVHTYRYDGDKLLALGSAECTYNELGCPTTYLGKALSWNESGKLTSFAIDADTTATFAYDIMGKRISKTANGTTVTFTYDGSGNLLSQSNGVKFLYDHAGIMGMTYGGNTYLYRKNVQGDVVALLNESGAIVARYEYDAWGNHKIFSAEDIDISNNSQYNEHVGNINPIRYRGYYFDAETGFYYLPARYYDPSICRFISRDDYSYLDPETVNGLNLFAYCGNNPIMCYDPSGHAWYHWVIGGALLVASIIATVATAGAAAGTIAASVHVIATGAMIGGLTSAAIGTVAGGMTYEQGNLSWSWSGAAEGFMWGSITGIISGAAGSALSSVGNGLSKLGNLGKLAYAGIQGLINSGITGGLTAIQGLITNSFSWDNVALSSAFGFVGGSLGTTKLGIGIRSIFVSSGLSLTETAIGELIEWWQSKTPVIIAKLRLAY